MIQLHTLQVKVLCGDKHCDKCAYLRDYDDNGWHMFTCSIWSYRTTTGMSNALKVDVGGALRGEACLNADVKPRNSDE